MGARRREFRRRSGDSVQRSVRRRELGHSGPYEPLHHGRFVGAMRGRNRGELRWQSLASGNRVEIVDETEMSLLSKFFEANSAPIGFFFGETDSGFKELIYFPGLCEACQKREVFFG